MTISLCEKCAHKCVCGFIEGYEDENVENCEHYAYPAKLKMTDTELKVRKSERQKNKYYTRKEQGLCVSCGKSVVSGTVRCADCLSYNKNFQKKKRDRNNSLELCRCGKPRYKDKKVCYDCYIKRIRYDSSRRKPTFREQGLCMQCGKKLPIEGHPFCEDCYEFRKNIAKKALFNEDGSPKHLNKKHPWNQSLKGMTKNDPSRCN